MRTEVPERPRYTAAHVLGVALVAVCLVAVLSVVWHVHRVEVESRKADERLQNHMDYHDTWHGSINGKVTRFEGALEHASCQDIQALQKLWRDLREEMTREHPTDGEMSE